MKRKWASLKLQKSTGSPLTSDTLTEVSFWCVACDTYFVFFARVIFAGALTLGKENRETYVFSNIDSRRLVFFFFLFWILSSILQEDRQYTVHKRFSILNCPRMKVMTLNKLRDVQTFFIASNISLSPRPVIYKGFALFQVRSTSTVASSPPWSKST